jgi:hypothetical protein
VTTWIEPLPEEERSYEAWLESRPPAVRAVAEQFRPWGLYRLTTTGQVVRVATFSEDGTVTVVVMAGYNVIEAFDYLVFGVDPQTIEPVLKVHGDA